MSTAFSPLIAAYDFVYTKNPATKKREFRLLSFVEKLLVRKILIDLVFSLTVCK